ncbi:Metallo-dependent hydrolase [Neolentinus lepideus HHB14362 ss-1]|uniref:Metallo-dependent hydrolase n=1 Tax=Neolentinus lepideus HHB14362 ss-1 TaxID=1314782 RepID=A0A165Q7Q5_9AGAM|nr:Metallo-dependent hydrolase [Neolentinus lepideus HHB14362 ss-1]
MTAISLRNGLLATFTAQDDPLSTPEARRIDLLIEGSHITAVTDPNTVQPPRDALVIDCTRKWIAPGFIDAHRHAFTSIFPHMEDWMVSEYTAKARFTITGLTTADDIYAAQLAGCLQVLNSGTTTLVDHFFAALSPAHIEKGIQATVESGVRSMFCISRIPVNTNLSPLEFNDPEARNMQMEMLRVLAAKYNGRLCPDGRVTLGFAYDLQGYYGKDEDDEIFSEVRKLGITPITAHYGGGPQGLGPTYKATELSMARGNPVVYEAVRRGVKAGLGTDSAVSSTEMFSAMRVALQWERGRLHESLAAQRKVSAHNDIPAASAFRLATLGGAEASHGCSKLGSLEVGKLGDVVIYDADSVNLAGCSDPFRGIVLHATDADVETVIVNGEIVAKQLQHHKGLLKDRLVDYDLEGRYKTVISVLKVPTV